MPGTGEGVQGWGNARDRVPEGANRKGISGQGRLSSGPGEPDACPVREEVAGNVPKSDEIGSRRAWKPLQKLHAGRGQVDIDGSRADH